MPQPPSLNWDQPGQYWDSDLTWDAGQSPNPGNVQPYLDLVTSEHNKQPDYLKFLCALLQPMADGQAVANGLVSLFDIDTAEGLQLDIIGLWVGRSRYLSVPLTGVYFTFDDGPGFDRGSLRGRFDPLNYLVVLPDHYYRLLLYATVAANHWDGSVPGAYAAYAIMFAPSGYQLAIIDNQDMTMDLVLYGPTPDAITLALFLGGYLDLKPVGVRVRNYIVSVNPDAKIFAFDVSPSSPIFGGFDVGAFPKFYEGT